MTTGRINQIAFSLATVDALDPTRGLDRSLDLLQTSANTFADVGAFIEEHLEVRPGSGTPSLCRSPMKTSQQSHRSRAHPSRPRWHRVTTCCRQRVGHIRRNNHVVLSLGGLQTIDFVARSNRQVLSREAPCLLGRVRLVHDFRRLSLHDPQSVSLPVPTSNRTVDRPATPREADPEVSFGSRALAP